MCHYCGANLAGSSDGKEQDSGRPVKLNRGDSIQYCGNCSEKNFKDSVNQAMSSTPSMTSIGPTALLQSIDSSMSNYSDMSVDANFNDRRYAEDSSTDSSQEDSNLSREQMDESNLPVVNLNGFHQTDKTVKLGNEDVDDINISGERVNTRATEASKMKEGADNNGEREISRVDEDMGTSLSNDEVDAEFWLPPEPEDQEDDIVGSVANYDDDDEECGDGVTWAKSSSLDSDKFKERKLKAMNDVRNGKFRGLVSHLVKSVGVDSSGDYGKNWVDIVTSLSWEAAAFLKPDAQEGKAMDPDGYVKVKCIATGLRTQSRIIKGLVFKKHAAHKHMPTKYKNPRLLLIQGSLDLSSSDGLSSFASMRQGKDNLKSIVDMIEMYHPNVVLVEKSVTRDIQESILAKGMTLVFDMKLHRLERVARCIGTPILSSEVAVGQHLRQCDSFHIEKFVEEHAIKLEGGKKQSKTLMFLEGAPSRLGCTILLMGASSNELKRIKCVVRCAVVMAYHLMLETSFLLDQSAMFSTISPTEVVDLALTSTQSISVGTVEATNSGPKESETESNSLSTLDIPISNGYHETGSHNLRSSSGGNTSLSFEAYDASTFPGLSLSASIEKVMSDSFPLLSDTTQGMSSAVSLDGRTQDDPADNAIQIFGASDTVALGDDNEKVGSEEEDLLNNEQSDLPESRYAQNDGDTIAAQMQNRDEISSVLDSESILVLMSSRNGSRGTICEQRHFSHIKFYRSFDVPLGKFLRDNLLNQRLQCKTCAEPPEAHFFYYAHHNKQLTIQVRRLPPVKSLPGAAEGKLWMWSRCGQCKLRDGSSKSTKRVVISTDARGLSFGKFLELSFSNHSSFSCLSSCGHSFHKDFLHFFGLGPMVAMFKYSTVVTYSVSLPPQMVEFNSAAREDFLKKDSESVYLKGISMFLDIEKSLKDLGARFVGVSLNIQGSRMEFSDILEMLKQEKAQFEADIQSATKNGSEGSAVCKLLRLNKVRMELYLESCVWDRRLHALISPDLKVIKTNPLDLQTREHLLPEQDGDAGEESGVIDIVVESCDSPQSKLDTYIDRNDFPVEEIPIDEQEEQSCGHDSLSTSIATGDVATPSISGLNVNGNEVHDLLVNASSRDYADAVQGNFRQDSFDSSYEFQTDKNIPIATDIERTSSGLYHSLTNGSRLSVSDFEKDKGWIWTPFTDIRREYMEDLRSGYLPKLDSSSSYGTGSVAQRMITDEGSRLHIPVGTDDYIVSDFEDEYSSIIACALTLLKDVETSSEDLVEDARREKGLDSRSQSSQNLTQSFSFPAPHWFSFGSSDGIRSPPSESYEDSHSSSFDGLDLLDKLVSYGASHPEVSMGLGKHLGKRKYSVVCLYASQFRQLRDRCCPSEVGYIASLSRCKNWDAKGGKSKSFFAKTLDDRFIIKEIKRTEFDSFMKFAPNYFEYMDQCYELGNQTCLAKILGIYQVVMRVAKNGKETKHDLLVMENLSFGRQIARQYDLKGALHARLTTSESGPGDVLLDQNFVNDMNVSPLYVSRKSKRNLQRAVYNDTNFLNSIHVMDYSLLVGVDTQRRELVCGIIDYLRQYTWDKQLENWVKSSLVVPKNQLPTIVSPKEYKKRFRKFIDTHFLSVPDRWCSQRSSNPCKLCGPVARDDSLHSESRETVSLISLHHGKQNGFAA